MKTVKTAWVFDVDGVLSHLIEEKTTQPEILDNLLKILIKGDILSFNTGRSIEWVSASILNAFLSKIKDTELLQNFFVSTEMGGMWSTFDINGEIATSIDTSVAMPDILKQKVIEIVDNKYSKTTEFEKKTTMITTKIKNGSTLEDYQRDQKELVSDLNELLHYTGFSNQLMVGTTNTGTNIQSKLLGKRKAIERIVDWISKRNLTVDKFITIGDSISDLDMPIKLYELNLSVEFIFVGGGEEFLGKTYPFKIITTKDLYEKGTLEFLKSKTDASPTSY